MFLQFFLSCQVTGLPHTISEDDYYEDSLAVPSQQNVVVITDPIVAETGKILLMFSFYFFLILSQKQFFPSGLW